MRSPGLPRLLTLIASALLFAFASSAQTPATDAPLVRLRFVQGDVRLSEGSADQPDLSKKWEQAEADLVLQQGFSLATGDGRAEIEIENGSWIYLAENSVLMFQDLRTQGNSSVIGLTLVNGIASFFVHRGPGDTFEVKTPVNHMSLADGAFLRLNSYLDGTLVTPQADLPNVNMNGVTKPQIEKGQTMALPGSSFVTPDALSSAVPPEGWDAWVSSQLQENQEATAAALKLSGLASPIPGLGELTKTGSFFPCPPYGTCWDSGERALRSQAGIPVGGIPQNAPNLRTKTGTPKWPSMEWLASSVMISFCPRIWRYFWIVPDPNNPGQTTTETRDQLEGAGFLTCHAGSYVRYHQQYVWVVGKKRKHSPVRWVKAGGKVGIVLRHPNDAKGKPLLNLKYGVMLPPKKLGQPMQNIKIDPTKQVTLLTSPPKKFAGDLLSHLQKVSSPQIQGRLLAGAAPHAPGALPEIVRPGIPYDYKTGQFIRPGTTIGMMTLKPTPVGGFSAGKPSSPRSDGQPSNNDGHHSNSGATPSRGSESAHSTPPPPEPRSAPAATPPPAPARTGRPN